MKKLVVGIIVVFLIILSGCGLSKNESRIYTDEQWIEDIDCVDRAIKYNHPDPFRKMTKEEWDESITNLKADLPNLTDMEIAFRIQALLSPIKDDHTNVNPISLVSSYNKNVEDYNDLLYFPINLTWFEDELRVSSVDKNNKDLLGAKLISINDISVSELLEKLHKCIPYDNNQSFKGNAQHIISTYDMLKFLKVVEKQEGEFTFEMDNGEIITRKLIVSPYENIDFVSLDSKVKGMLVSKEKPEGESDYYWAKHIEEDNILYFKINKFISAGFDGENFTNTKDLPSFYDYTNKLIDLINSSEFDKFVIDLRGNPGGNFDMIKYLLNHIETKTDIKANVKTYVLIDKDSRSATPISTVDIVNHLDATVIGEETGGNVNGYGYSTSSKPITLPNSKINIMLSETFKNKIPGYEGGYKPDFNISQRYDSYINGIDDCYEFVKNDK